MASGRNIKNGSKGGVTAWPVDGPAGREIWTARVLASAGSKCWIMDVAVESVWFSSWGRSRSVAVLTSSSVPEA